MTRIQETSVLYEWVVIIEIDLIFSSFLWYCILLRFGRLICIYISFRLFFRYFLCLCSFCFIILRFRHICRRIFWYLMKNYTCDLNPKFFKHSLHKLFSKPVFNHFQMSEWKLTLLWVISFDSIISCKIMNRHIVKLIDSA